MSENETEPILPEWVDDDATLLPTRADKLLELEEAADEFLAADRRDRGVTKHSDMRDYLSFGQLRTRLKREIYTSVGYPDASLVSGIFVRTYPDRGDGADLRTMGWNDQLDESLCGPVTVSNIKDRDNGTE